MKPTLSVRAFVFSLLATVQVNWGAPHVYVVVDAKAPNSKEPKLWKLQMASPACMQQHGVDPKTMSVGSRITVNSTPRSKNRASVTVPVFTMVYDNKTIRVSRSPEDQATGSGPLDRTADPRCAP